MRTPVKFDWIAIRAMFEAGDSISSIARHPGYPSKQAISRRSIDEGWTVIDRPPPELAMIPFGGLNDQQRYIVTEIAKGATQRLAAQMAGRHESTVSDWKKDEVFSRALMAAKAAKVKRRLDKIDTSADWRAAGWLLERDVDSMDEYMPPNSSRGMTGTTFNVLGHVNLGFDRILEHTQEPLVGLPEPRP